MEQYYYDNLVYTYPEKNINLHNSTMPNPDYGGYVSPGRKGLFIQFRVRYGVLEMTSVKNNFSGLIV